MYWLYNLLALILILILHDAGYFLAMRALHLRDPAVYLLPWRGRSGPGVGSLGRAPAWQQLVVLLAGPGPGLLLTQINAATAAGPWGKLMKMSGPSLSSFLVAATVELFFVNWLTLLPIKPLPGWRLFELLWGGSRKRQVIQIGLLFLLLPMSMDLMAAVLVLGALLPGFVCLAIAWIYSANARGYATAARTRARGGVLFAGAAMYLLLYAFPLVSLLEIALIQNPPWQRLHDAQEQRSNISALNARLAAAKTADERVGLYLALAEVSDRKEAKQAVRQAFASIDPKQPDSLSANRARIRYSEALETSESASSLALLAQAEASLLKFHPEDTEDLERIYSQRSGLLEIAKAPVDKRIDNMRQLVAVTERGGSPDDALEQQRDLAEMLLDNQRMAEAITVLQSAFHDAHHVQAKHFADDNLPTSVVCELMWAELAAGKPQDALALAADPLVRSDLVEREQDPNVNDAYEGNEEQARAYALMDVGQAAAAVPVFANLLDKEIQHYGDDSGGLVGPFLLDLLVAQTRAGQPTQSTKDRLHKLLISDPNSLDYLRSELRVESTNPGNFSVNRARAELGALNSL